MAKAGVKRAPCRPSKALVETALAWLRLQGKKGGVPLVCDMCHRPYVEASEYVGNEAWGSVTCLKCAVNPEDFKDVVWAYISEFKGGKS